MGALCVFLPAKATEWWLRPTLCQPSNAFCYPSIEGAGFTDEWDSGAVCRGKKIVCDDALNADCDSMDGSYSKAEISNSAIINVDFDVSILDSRPDKRCFGVRRTRNNGTSASVNGNWVNVWCAGVLDAPDESLATGYIITSGQQPDCEELKYRGYIGILNGQCYGRPSYPASDFYLQCETGRLLPTTIVKLGGAGADDIQIMDTKPSYPITEVDAAVMFNAMIENAAEARRIAAEAKLAEAE